MTIYDKMLREYQDSFINNYNNVSKFIVNFISKNADALGSKNPGNLIYFTKTDKAEFLDTVKADPKIIKRIIEESTYIEKNWIISNEPLNILMDCMVFFYYSLRDKYKDLKYPPHDFVNLMFAIRFYSSLQQRQFQYGVNEEVMEYTVENLSKKYNITKVNTMFELLTYYAESNIVKWEEAKMMDVTTDKSIDGYMKRLNIRLSSFIKNVAEEYYKNHKNSKRIVEEQQEIVYEEGKSQLKTQTNVSNDITIATRNIYTAFKQNPINITLLETACKNTNAAFSEMHIVLEDMRKDASEHYSENLILNIISYFLASEMHTTNEIKSPVFLDKMTTAYKVSHTENQYILKAKEILNEIMEKYSEFYTKTNRTASKSELKSGCYRYFVYICMKYC